MLFPAPLWLTPGGVFIPLNIDPQGPPKKPAPWNVPTAPVSRARFRVYEVVQALAVFIAVSASILVL